VVCGGIDKAGTALLRRHALIAGVSQTLARVAASALGLAAFEGVAAPVDFSREVLPLLSDRCFYCHGPDEKHRKGGLRLDEEAGAKAMGKHGAAVVPGKPEESLLLARVRTTDPDEVMPPPEVHKELTDGQRETLARWIAEGAPWGKHWAFTPLRRPELPAEGHPVDVLVGAKLAKEGLGFAEAAEAATLLRRTSLALMGMPPTLEEQEAWLADGTDAGWERVVERLLASPAYGERMAWDWLEAARYADTNGYQGDGMRTMWPWRDWVVGSYNRNQRWDEFTVWQIAGDLLPGATDEQRLATAFLRNHPINGEGGRIAEENRIDYVMDMTETTGTVWLALTFNCCRCHDHKFDPLTNKDYYSLGAFFNQTPVDGGGGDPQTPPVLKVPDREAARQLETVRQQLADVRKGLDAEREKGVVRREAWEREVVKAGSPWVVVAPRTAKAEGSALTIQRDRTVLNSGANPEKDNYEVTAVPGAGRWTGMRLDVLRHATMTAGGLARSDSGNFVLTSLRVERQDGEGGAQVVAMEAVEATYEQGGLGLAGVLDDHPATGWAVHEGRMVDRSHAAVLKFPQGLETGEGTVLRFRFRHESGNKHHNMGRFRVSLTQMADPVLTKTDPGLAVALRTPAGERDEAQREAVVAAWEEADAGLAGLRRRVSELEAKERQVADAGVKVMVMADRAELRKTFVLDHGLYNKPLGEVSAALPGFLATLAADAPRNRLGLAQWIVSPENPLTARVAVNRFWQMLFGIGLVKSAEDFGVQAEFPMQEALLDWLAADFRDSGWDVKRLLRLIVTSRTWRQSSRVTGVMLEKDPGNRLLGRGPRYRMPSWMIRDQALAAGGLVRVMSGGSPVLPWQPEGVWEEATFGTVKYQRGSGDDLRRRSLYTFWRRIAGPTMFFDTGSRLVCSVKPLRTNTPLHALATTNDVTYVEAARAMALNSAGVEDAGARISAMSRRLLGRAATGAEIAVLRAGWERHRQRFAGEPERAVKLLGEGESPVAVADRTPELAAWTMTALTLLNMDEALNLE
jgi:hypothetical protein